MKTIKLDNCEAVALVDDEDFELLAGSRWRRFGGYAVRDVLGKMEEMSHVILGAPAAGAIWDHKDGNLLNNQRGNLRSATRSQNNQNRCKSNSPAMTSRYKGVRKSNKCWLVSIRVEGETIELGRFEDEAAAAAAYDEAARFFFGEFARLNFPSSGEQGCLRSV